jgi:hypothetical protein
MPRNPKLSAESEHRHSGVSLRPNLRIAIRSIDCALRAPRCAFALRDELL